MGLHCVPTHRRLRGGANGNRAQMGAMVGAMVRAMVSGLAALLRGVAAVGAVRRAL